MFATPCVTVSVVSEFSASSCLELELDCVGLAIPSFLNKTLKKHKILKKTVIKIYKNIYINRFQLKKLDLKNVWVQDVLFEFKGKVYKILVNTVVRGIQGETRSIDSIIFRQLFIKTKKKSTLIFCVKWSTRQYKYKMVRRNEFLAEKGDTEYRN